MSHWPPIGRDDLKQAAESDAFAGVLPQLVRRLIAESADGPVDRFNHERVTTLGRLAELIERYDALIFAAEKQGVV